MILCECILEEKCRICLNNSNEKIILELLKVIENEIEIGVYYSKSEIKIFHFLNLISNDHFLNKSKKLEFDAFGNEIKNKNDKTKDKNYIVIYKIIELLNKFKNKEDAFITNLKLFFSIKNNERDQLDIKIFTLIKKYDNCLKLLNKSVDDVKDILHTFNSMTKKNIYPISEELNKNKENISKDLYDLYSNRAFYFDIYSLIIFKFSYEKIFNQNLILDTDDFQFNLERYPEIITDQFNNEKFMLIFVDLNKNDYLIKRATYPFTKFMNSNFEEIFPDKFKQFALKKFKDLLDNNKDKFKFEFFINFDSDLIKSLKLDCVTHRSFNLDQIFIFCGFEINKEKLIIFEEKNIFVNSYKLNNLITYSEGLKKNVIFTQRNFKMFSIIFKSFISFEDIFKKENLNLNEKNEVINQDEYSLNYLRYFNNIIKNNVNLESIEDEEIKRKLIEIKRLIKNDKNIKFKIQNKFDIRKDEFKSYKIYSIKHLMNQIRTNLSNKEIIDNLDDFNQFNELDGLIDEANDSQKFSMSNTSSANRSYLRENKEKVNSAQYKVNIKIEKNMTRFKKLTFFVNLFLIIFSFIFLIFGLVGNKSIGEIYQILNKFNELQNEFFQTSLSLFYNVGVYHNNYNKTYDEIDVDNYWIKFENNKNITIKLGDYANSELDVKIDLLKENLIEVQDIIFPSKYYTEIKELLDLKNDFFLFGVIGNTISLNSQNEDFFNSLILFMNKCKLAKFTQTLTMMHIFNFNLETKNFDASNIINRNLSSVQKAVYEMVINYPTYYKNFKQISNKLKTLYTEELNRVLNLNLFFSLSLIALHFLIILIAISILRYLNKTTKDQNKLLLKNITEESTKNNLIKLNSLQIMLQFYIEDPFILQTKIHNSENEKYRNILNLNKKNQINNRNKKEEKINEKIFNKFNKNGTQFYIDDLIFKLAKIITILLTLYFIYAIIFNFLFVSSLENLGNVTNYLTDHSQINNNLMNCVMLLQTILLSNQTDLDLAKFFNNNIPISNLNNFGYISTMLEDTKDLNNKLEILYENDNFYNQIKIELDSYLNCEDIYTKINDPVIEKLTPNYEGENLKFSLIEVCKTFPEMKLNSYSNIFEYILFSTSKLIKQYEFNYGNYIKMKEINNDEIFYDGFTINVLIIRPVQNYIIDQFIYNLNEEMKSRNLYTFIIFLILNIFIEGFLFLIINNIFIREILVITKNIKCLSDCVK